MRVLLTIAVIALTAGCGTITTLSSSDDSLSRDLKKRETYCESLSRVYSGVSYNLCVLNSKPRDTEIALLVGFYLVDGAFSLLSDTLVLPYTIYRQSADGSIPIKG